MIIEVRKTLTGTEYWDTEEKRTLFVPKGEKPKFEVTTELDTVVKDAIKTSEVVVNSLKEIEKMTVAELRDFAAENNIDIPADIKKKDEIIKFLLDAK